MERSARHYLTIKAAKEFKKEIEQAGLDNLQILADKGISIVGTYLEGCSPSEKKKHKQELSGLLQMGVTLDMVISELARQMPELVPIMEAKEGYKRGEIQNLEAFVKEEQETKK